MSGLEWLNQLMLWLGRWFPRLVLVKPTHVGVWFGPRGRRRQVGPGLHWYWPLTSEFTVVSLRMRSCEISTQLYGREVVSAAVFWKISDALKLMLLQNDIFSMLDDSTQAALSNSYKSDQTNEQITEAMRLQLTDVFKTSGVDILSVFIISRGRAVPLRNFSDWANHAASTL